MNDCIWCDEPVIWTHACAKCGEQYPKICRTCHARIAHKERIPDKEAHKYELKGKGINGSGRQCGLSPRFADYQGDEDMNRRAHTINQFTGAEI